MRPCRTTNICKVVPHRVIPALFTIHSKGFLSQNEVLVNKHDFLFLSLVSLRLSLSLSGNPEEGVILGCQLG